MFGTATGQTGVLFGGTQNQNLFSTNQPTQQTGFFGPANIVGTTTKYTPTNGTDTIQKNNQTVTVATKLNCISSMKEYDTKSLEELRFEDYTANRVYGQKPAIFGAATGPTTGGLFGSQSSMFQSNSPFGAANLQSGQTQPQLFGSTNQTNAFGSKPLFGGTATSTNSAFGSFTNQSKPSAIFGPSSGGGGVSGGGSTANKSIFGSNQPTQTTGLFGGGQSQSLFGQTNQPAQQTGFFTTVSQSGSAGQQNQSSVGGGGLFNNTTSTSSFGFQPTSNTGLFGSANNNTTNKPFGTTPVPNTAFTFSSANTSSTNTPLFGTGTTSATGGVGGGGLFSQNNTNTGFGGISKPQLFTTPASSQSLFQSSTPAAPPFGQSTTLFGTTGTAKSSQSPFGPTFNTTSQPKTGIFGATNSNTGFGTQNTGTMFPNFSVNQPFNSTIATASVAPLNNSAIQPAIGMTSPAEAVFQQQLMQQKVLSLVSNRPYGVNRLFMFGGSPLAFTSGDHSKQSSSVVNPEAANSNLLSLVIKRNESDAKFDSNQRRKILNQKTKLIPNQLYKVFSGFDQDEDIPSPSTAPNNSTTNKSTNSIDQSFFTKREDWKYLPPDAFDKSHNRSLLINDSSSSPNIVKDSKILSNIAVVVSSRNNYCSTPISSTTGATSKHEAAIQVSPVYNTRTSPIHFSSPSFTGKNQSIVNQTNGNRSMMKEESLSSIINHSNPQKSIFSNKTNENINTENDDDDDDDDDDESIDGDVGGADNEAAVCDRPHSNSNVNKHNENKTDGGDSGNKNNNSNRKSCSVKLTKQGYYTSPKIDVMDQMVVDNSCWVQNFIIGRTDFGSIRFPGYTNVYGLNLDELVSIQRNEVCVYPDDENKPEHGFELNKQAQVVLQHVFPIDKSTGKSITDAVRLVEMRFEDRLRRSTERMEAKFISYQPNNGVWIFEVEHFSKYTFIDSSDEDDDNGNGQSQKSPSKNPPVTVNRKAKQEAADTSNIENGKVSIFQRVVSAEADSMTGNQIDEEHDRFVRTIKQRSAIDRLLNNSTNSRVLKTKQSLYNHFDSDEEIDNNRYLCGLNNQANCNRHYYNNENKNYSFGFDGRDKYQPQSKKFESCEMGEKIFISSLNNSRIDYSSINHDYDAGNQLMMIEENNKRPVKSLTAEHLAPTVLVESNCRISNHLYVPSHLRNIQSTKMPYLFNQFKKYFDLDAITVTAYKKYSDNVSIVQGNRFRVGTHLSCNPKSPGWKYFQISNNIRNANDNLIPFNSFHKQTSANCLLISSCNFTVSDYQEKLMKSSLEVSDYSIDSDNMCPSWGPRDGLDVLKSYLTIHNETENVSNIEKSIFRRIFKLCEALWADLPTEIISEEHLPVAMHDLGRKQLFSKWIKMECRVKLEAEIKLLLNTAKTIDAENCNTVILHALCSGEVKVACQLAVASKQHRLSLLIAQAASNAMGREILREQINLWVQNRTDLYIPPNLLSIYLLLSGQTSLALSDGTVLLPFKDMCWVRAMGIHFWHTQSYLGSIKSALQSYDDAFQHELDVAPPFPIDFSSDATINGENDPSDYPFFDCCYHLIKLYCDRLYDLDTALNPPTISQQDSHIKLEDWSVSWHLANFLTGMKFMKHVPDKLSVEWGAQLERSGNWTVAAFVYLHVSNSENRTRLVKNLVARHARESRDLTEGELFLVEKLHIPLEWVHEGKAIYSKSIGNVELEAYHWLRAGQLDKSHQLYIDHIIPNLLISDKFETIKDILDQFINGINDHRGNQDDQIMKNWRNGGDLYLKYIYIITSLRTLKLTNKLANHSILMEYGGGENEIDVIDQLMENDEFANQMSSLKLEAMKLSQCAENFRISNDAQRVCKKQIVTVCSKFLQTYSSEVF